MRVIIFLVFLLLILILFSINEEKLSKKMKFMVFGILFAVFGLIYLYEASYRKEDERNLSLVTSFDQGQSLVCKGVEISNSNFIYLEKTKSFLAKQDVSANFKGLKFDIRECKRAKN